MENILEISKKANELYSNGNFEEALKLYLSVLSFDINNSISNCNAGLTYEVLGEVELAVAFYKRAIRLDEKNVRAVNNLARIYIDIVKDFDAAKTYLDHAIQTEPNDAEAYNLYGNLSLAEKDYKMAESYFKKSIFLDENYFKNYYDLARAYIGLNDTYRAKEALNKSLELRNDFKPAQDLKDSLK